MELPRVCTFAHTLLPRAPRGKSTPKRAAHALQRLHCLRQPQLAPRATKVCPRYESRSRKSLMALYTYEFTPRRFGSPARCVCRPTRRNEAAPSPRLPTHPGVSQRRGVSMPPTFAHIAAYCGPPPPSGTVQLMNSCGVLIEQHLQCTQFCALICNRILPSASSGTYSYTFAGQNLPSGPS